MSKISLVIPVYNVEQFLRACLDSVLAQTFHDYEVIIVDDGSTDGGGKICDEYAERDDRFRVIHQKNQGLSAARNNGTELTTGEYIGYIDSDDVATPDYLSTLYETVCSSGCAIAVSRYANIDEKTETLSEAVGSGATVLLSGREASKKMIADHERFMITANGKLYHRSLIGILNYPIGKKNEDEYVTYRALYEAPSVAICGKAMYGYRHRSGSIMANPAPRMDGLEALYGAIGYFEGKNDEEIAADARRRYLLYLQITWYRAYVLNGSGCELCCKLKREHKQFFATNRKRIGKLNVLEFFELQIFRLSPEMYAIFANIAERIS